MGQSAEQKACFSKWIVMHRTRRLQSAFLFPFLAKLVLSVCIFPRMEMVSYAHTLLMISSDPK